MFATAAALAATTVAVAATEAELDAAWARTLGWGELTFQLELQAAWGNTLTLAVLRAEEASRLIVGAQLADALMAG